MGQHEPFNDAARHKKHIDEQVIAITHLNDNQLLGWLSDAMTRHLLDRMPFYWAPQSQPRVKLAASEALATLLSSTPSDHSVHCLISRQLPELMAISPPPRTIYTLYPMVAQFAPKD